MSNLSKCDTLKLNLFGNSSESLMTWDVESSEFLGRDFQFPAGNLERPESASDDILEPEIAGQENEASLVENMGILACVPPRLLNKGNCWYKSKCKSLGNVNTNLKFHYITKNCPYAQSKP
jgi:hypothetical protein